MQVLTLVIIFEMTEQEYKSKMDQIDQNAETQRKALMIDFAKDQIKFKIGDIIDNGIWCIKIESIGTYKWLGLPEPTYKGRALTKQLVPKKSGEYGSIYGNEHTILIKES
jgi:hypothetical protein